MRPNGCGSAWKRCGGIPRPFSASLEEYENLTLDEVKKRLWGGGNAFVAGAFDGLAMVAMAGFYRDRGPKVKHKGHVWGVYVTPERRGMGLGKRIMRFVLEQASSIEGIEQLMLSVAATQTAAVRLYRSSGFERFGREPRALKVGGRAIDEEYMVLRLTDPAPHRPVEVRRKK